MSTDRIILFSIPVLMALLIMTAAVTEILKQRGMIERGTAMWKVYIAARILPGVLGMMIAGLVVWYFFLR